MTQQDHVYFHTTGDEAGAFVLVRIFKDGGDLAAEITMEGSNAQSVGLDAVPTRGAVPTMLREAREFAALNGYDLRVKMIGVEWPKEMGSLVG